MSGEMLDVDVLTRGAMVIDVLLLIVFVKYFGFAEAGVDAVMCGCDAKK